MSFEEKIKSGFYPSQEEFEKLNTQKLNRAEICALLNISVSTYKKLRRYYNLKPKKHKVNKDDYVIRAQKSLETLKQRYGEKGSATWVIFQEERKAKQRATCMQKYGVEDPSVLPEFIEKKKQTFMERYGVDNPMKLEVFLQKAQKTSLEKYGIKFHITSPEVQEKIIATNMERYGVPYSGMAPSTTQKRNETNLERYGFTCALSNPEIRKKGFETMSKNGTQAVLSSKQQEYLNQLFGGELNYLYGYYHIDSYVKEDNIGVEYSGSGHDLSVRTGRENKVHFEGKEKARKNFFKNNGLPILEFFSKKDKLPSDEELIVYYNEAKQKFAEGYLYCSVNLETKEIYYE